MGTNWTREQRQVIDLRKRNILVSAAAGSGKTAVLVERILAMIADDTNPIDIDRLLIVTFTKAAAAEMRERIGRAIEKKLEDDPQNMHLQRQSALVHIAKITTIHSFCLSIIRNYSSQLEIDPGFRVAEEGELRLLRADVLEALLGDYYESGSESFGNFIETYAMGKADYGISDLILRLYDFSQSYPWPQKWLEECRRTYDHTELKELSKTAWMEYLIQDVQIQAEELVLQSEYGLKLCKEPDGPYMYIKAYESDRAALLLLQKAQTYEEICQVLQYLSFDRLSPKKDESVDEYKKSAARAIRERIKSALKRIKEFYYMEDVNVISQDLAGSREAVGMLIQLTLDFTQRFRDKKREKNLLDFNDFEHLALEILVEENGGEPIPTQTAVLLSHQYEEILIDEYQDSNLVQETLLKSISRERRGQPNIFMVGDVKQSIYRFRLARPELFMKKYEDYKAEDGPYQKIELHKNFRSRASVLNSINFIFYRIMRKALGNIEYTEDSALYAGAFYPETTDLVTGTSTELLLVDLEEGIADKKSKEAAAQTDYTVKELEAKLIAKRIKELTDQEKGLSILDKESGNYRIAEYRDIVILLRSFSGWADVFVNVLVNEGVPAFAQSQSGYFTALEVQTVLCMLKIIDNPMDDIPLAAVLKSPIVGLSSKELAIMVSAFKNQAKTGVPGGIYGAWLNYLELADGLEALKRKLLNFRKQLNHFRHLKTYLNIHDLLYRVLEETGYYAYASAMPLGEVRKGNLDMLIEKAVVYEKTSYHGLFHFIRYIEKLQKYDTDYGEAAPMGENDNTVRIVTIHKSKGLEYPIVFLGGMSKAFNKQDSYHKILLHPDLGIATDYVDVERRIKSPTLMKKVFRRKTELEDMGEELRVLYVALTRAKEKLIMTGTGKDLPKKLEEYKDSGGFGMQLPFTYISKANSYLDWILMCLGSPDQYPEAKDLFKIQVFGIKDLIRDELEKQIVAETAKEAIIAMDISAVFHEETRKELEKKLLYSYPYEASVSMHTKMSVSELKQYGQMIDETKSELPFIEASHPTLPGFLQENKPLKGALKGTAYHRVLQLLDFKEMDHTEKAGYEVRQLLEDGKISHSVYNAIYIPDLETFFHSLIGQRMIKAAKNNSLHKEEQFVMGVTEEISGEMVLIQGIIDAFFEEEDGLVLVDYKTDYILEGQEKELTNRYRVQLEYYGMALEKMTGKKVKEKIIYSIGLGKGIIF